MWVTTSWGDIWRRIYYCSSWQTASWWYRSDGCLDFLSTGMFFFREIPNDSFSSLRSLYVFSLSIIKRTWFNGIVWRGGEIKPRLIPDCHYHATHPKANTHQDSSNAQYLQTTKHESKLLQSFPSLRTHTSQYGDALGHVLVRQYGWVAPKILLGAANHLADHPY